MTYHRWVLHDRVPDYLLIGWLALPTLEGTGHGIYSAHCAWLCECKPIEPCLKGRCYSPVACNAFGYCRERNFARGINGAVGGSRE